MLTLKKSENCFLFNLCPDNQKALYWERLLIEYQLSYAKFEIRLFYFFTLLILLRAAGIPFTHPAGFGIRRVE